MDETPDTSESPDDSGMPLLPEKYRSLARALAWAALILLPLGIYLPVVWFDVLLAWDDNVFVVDRPTIQGWWSSSWSDRLFTPEVGYPIPVPTMIMAVAHSLAGFEGYISWLHTASLALHLVNTLLAVILVRRLLPRLRDTLVPLLVVLAWTCHPATVESVTWLTNLKNLTAGLGFMLAMIGWDMFLRRDEKLTGPLLLSALGLALGLGSRPEAGLVPVILAAWTLFATPSGTAVTATKRRQALILIVPLAVAGVAWSLLGKSLHDVFMAEMGTTPPVAGAVDHVRGIVESVGFYVQRTVGGIPSNPLYPRREVGGTLALLLGALALVAVAALAVILWRSERRHRLGTLAVLALLYAPFSNISPLPRFVADAYLYLFGLVFFAFVAGLALDTFRSRRSAAILLAVWFVFMGITLGESTDYVPRWATTYRLWQPVADNDPTDPNPWHFMVYEAVLRNDMERGYELMEASKQSPIFRNSPPWYAPAIYDHAGHTDEAFTLAKLAYQNEVEQFRLARLTLDLLIHHDRPLSSLDDTPGFAKWVVEEYASRPEWPGEASPYGTTEARIRAYLAKQDGDWLTRFERIRSDPPEPKPKGLDAVF
jgi:hypothetical protein